MWIVKALLHKTLRKGEGRPILALPCCPGRTARTAIHVALCADDPAASHRKAVAMSKPKPPRYTTPLSRALGHASHGPECRPPPQPADRAQDERVG